MTSSNLSAHRSQQELTGEVEAGSWSLVLSYLSIAELPMDKFLASLFHCRHFYIMG